MSEYRFAERVGRVSGESVKEILAMMSNPDMISFGGGSPSAEAFPVAFIKEAAQKIFSRCEVNGLAFDFEAILWAKKLGMTIKEIPVRIINHRESKVHVFSDAFKMLLDLHKMKKRIGKITIELA